MAGQTITWETKVQGQVNERPANEKLTFEEINELVEKFNNNAGLFNELLEQKVSSALIEPTIASGAYTFPTTDAKCFDFAITENTTLTMPTLSNSTSIVFTAYITGDFSLTIPSTTALGDTYDGTISNRLTFECRRNASGTQTNIVTIENLA